MERYRKLSVVWSAGEKKKTVEAKRVERWKGKKKFINENWEMDISMKSLTHRVPPFSWLLPPFFVRVVVVVVVDLTLCAIYILSHFAGYYHALASLTGRELWPLISSLSHFEPKISERDVATLVLLAPEFSVNPYNITRWCFQWDIANKNPFQRHYRKPKFPSVRFIGCSRAYISLSLFFSYLIFCTCVWLHHF